MNHFNNLQAAMQEPGFIQQHCHSVFSWRSSRTLCDEKAAQDVQAEGGRRIALALPGAGEYSALDGFPMRPGHGDE
jgi:hypothetical protein